MCLVLCKRYVKDGMICRVIQGVPKNKLCKSSCELLRFKDLGLVLLIGMYVNSNLIMLIMEG